jgi:hypothetical protein
MPIGGFNGTDPSPTLAQFKRRVAQGEVHYFIAVRAVGHHHRHATRHHRATTTSAQISTWVAARFHPRFIGEAVLYDLTEPRVAG